MIDFDFAKERFLAYTKQYDIDNGRIHLKVIHTFKVADLCQKIAEDLHFSSEDVQLAKLIGLLHDIGRFEQVRIYNTFKDSVSTDHAELGVKILFQDDFIRQFILDPSYDFIIQKAVSNHNKYQIEDGLDQRTLLFCQLIRDADKADIFRVICEDTFQNTCMSDISDPYSDTISDSIYADFMNEKSLHWTATRTPLDVVIAHLALIFDFNFLYGLRYINEKDFLPYIFQKVHCTDPFTNQRWTNIQEKVLNYLEKKLK